jgi:signal transduction histidine kinase
MNTRLIKTRLSQSLGLRLLSGILLASLVLAAALTAIVHYSYRGYQIELAYARAVRLAENVLRDEPELWQKYQRSPSTFGQLLREFARSEPNTGLFLIGFDGRVLASAGEGRIFWSSKRFDLSAIRKAHTEHDPLPVFAEDPDTPDAGCIVAARPLMSGGVEKAWLYVVARDADVSGLLPDLIRRYVVQGASRIGLLTLAIGIVLSFLIVAFVTRPLAALTAAAERIKTSGFQSEEDFGQMPLRKDEIGRLAQTFKDMLAKLRVESERTRQIDGRRREMISSVSHDLRTPLTALTGQIETIRLKGDALSPIEQHRFLDGALANAMHLRRLIDALAELGRLESPDFSIVPEPVALGELADDIVQRMQALAQQKGLSLKLIYPDALPIIQGDAGLIDRALTNLIDNALRMTPNGGTVTVSCEKIGPTVRLQVTDDGPGIAEADLGRVFDRFFQADRQRTQRGSAGLGLAIVKRVAQLHQAQIAVLSRMGEGAQFRIDFRL